MEPEESAARRELIEQTRKLQANPIKGPAANVRIWLDRYLGFYPQGDCHSHEAESTLSQALAMRQGFYLKKSLEAIRRELHEAYQMIGMPWVHKLIVLCDEAIEAAS